jgi:hypothetical protein
MERKAIITKATISSRNAILEEILNASKRVMEQENDCFQKSEVEINYSVLAQGLLRKYEELVTYYPDYSSSEFLQELRKKMEDIQHLKSPHNNIKLVSYLTEILLNKGKELLLNK